MSATGLQNELSAPGAGLGDALRRFARVRANSEALAAPLSPEDWMLQSMPDASPVKWNLAHTSWFFETFILVPYKDGYRPFNEAWGYLFNSYYNLVGDMHPRAQRGLLSRPSAQEILDYRRHVTSAVTEFFARDDAPEACGHLLATGIAHEEQHQELLLTDIKYSLSLNPLSPAAYPAPAPRAGAAGAPAWTSFPGGMTDIGAAGGFHFDNEGPRHQIWLGPFELADAPVTNAAYLAFMEAGGYDDSRHWFADGWALRQSEGWRAPLYWRRRDGEWREFTLFGERAIDWNAPVAHVSHYEAAAYAEWTGFRLPTEFEWEHASAGAPVDGSFLTDRGPAPPAPAQDHAGLRQMFGDVWEWTASPYVAYPGFRAPPGAVGEYNAKFMSSQMVLRGGSCATPEGHVRRTYRNFFPPHARWQFSGIRLARDV